MTMAEEKGYGKAKSQVADGNFGLQPLWAFRGEGEGRSVLCACRFVCAAAATSGLGSWVPGGSAPREVASLDCRLPWRMLQWLRYAVGSNRKPLFAGGSSGGRKSSNQLGHRCHP